MIITVCCYDNYRRVAKTQLNIFTESVNSATSMVAILLTNDEELSIYYSLPALDALVSRRGEIYGNFF